jgi:hypothetical protein
LCDFAAFSVGAKHFFPQSGLAEPVKTAIWWGDTAGHESCEKYVRAPIEVFPGDYRRMEPIMNRPGMSPQPQAPRRRLAWPQPVSEAQRFLSKTEAEEMLDWHEAHGARNLRVAYHVREGFRIRIPRK